MLEVENGELRQEFGGVHAQIQDRETAAHKRNLARAPRVFEFSRKTIEDFQVKPHLSRLLTVFSIAFSGLSSAAADPATVPETTSVVKVAGLVQFVEGHAVKTEPSGIQTNVVYQTVLYEGDRLEASAGSVLKIQTRRGCLIVTRGAGVVAAPVDKKPWRLRASSARLICTGLSAPEVFGVANAPVAIQNGEVLTVAEPFRAMALRGDVKIRGQALNLRKLYVVGETVSEATPVPDEDELRALNETEKPPRESAAWPAPPARPTVRLVLSPVFGGDSVFYDAQDLNQNRLSGTGPRLQLHFRQDDDTSLIFALTFRESEDKSKQGTTNGPPPDGASTQLQNFLFEVGKRQHHDRWWSPYYRFGGGVSKAKIGITTNKGTFFNYSRFSYDFFVVSAAFGIDANLMPSFLSPFGFYVSAELQAIQSLWRKSEAQNESNSMNGPSSEPWRLTSVNATVGAGIQLQF